MQLRLATVTLSDFMLRDATFCSSTFGRRSGQSARIFLQSSEMGPPPPPVTLTRRRVCPPSFGAGGRDTLAGGEEVKGSNSDEGDIYMYFVIRQFQTFV